MSHYQPEIDGLRAVAVLSVLLFHAGIAGFSGGYVGVDVFFVISGFLITRLIVNEIGQTGRFDFFRFYTRRARRLLPASFTTFAVSTVLALMLLSPESLERFAGSLIYAVLSLSNFFFWWEADYFDVAASSKPLLHTWSLAVEEQFYVFWPALLVLALLKGKRWLAPAVLVGLGMLSLVLSEYWLRTDASAAFYLLPARVIEFAIGGGLVWITARLPVGGFSAEVMLAAGLALIAWPVFTYTENTPFPGLNALAPCLGTALAIHAGSARWLGHVLRNPLSVWIGRASYSIYLVHWPIIVFFGLYRFADPSPAETYGLLAASLALGWLQFRFVEERFRYERGAAWTRPAFWGAIASIALTLIVPAWAMRSDGLPIRIPAERFVLANNVVRRQESADYCRNVDPAKPKSLFTCQNNRGAKHDIILWGDSHAQHLIAGFSNAFPEHNIYVLYRTACVPQSGFGGFTQEFKNPRTQECIERNRAAMEFLKTYPASTVVLSAAKRDKPVQIAKATSEILKALSEAGHNAFLLGDFIRPGRFLGDCVSVPDILISDADIARRCQGDPRLAEIELKYNRELSALLPTEMISPNDIQCPNGSCQFFEGKRLLYRDDHHLSPFGSTVMIAKMKGLLPIP
jgi:peptidoglycan/LPS O-acetylase OafA/YrhL